MQAHDDMGKPGVNITYEVVKRAADANGTTVAQALQTIARTAEVDRDEHPDEYAARRGRERPVATRVRLLGHPIHRC
jgi:hypothetical protein